MSNGFFIEEGDYFVFCSAQALSDGTWEASAMFERAADRLKSTVPGLRHRIVNTTFDSEGDALQAANQLAIQLINDGKVGLE